MVPQKGGADAAENDFYIRVQFFGNAGDLYSAPAVGMQNGKTDDIRLFFFQRSGDPGRIFIDIVPVENLDIISVLL